MESIWGIVSVMLTITAFSFYFRSIFRRETKPHMFSWLIWGLTTGIGYIGQVAGGAEAGSWVLGVTSVICFTVFVLSFWYGTKNVYKLDWFSLFIALVAIVLWQITDDLLVSVVLVTVADLIGTIPTLRKCYSYPWDETVIHFSIEFSKFLISFLAMSAFNPLTVLYPLGAMLSNLSLVLMIVWRRKCMSGN